MCTPQHLAAAAAEVAAKAPGNFSLEVRWLLFYVCQKTEGLFGRCDECAEVCN